MPFELVEKGVRRPRTTSETSPFYIQHDSVRLPARVYRSVGSTVNVLIDREGGQIAIRAADDGDQNGYVVSKYGILSCRTIRDVVKERGLTFPVSVPITYDADLNAWVADLNDGK